MKSSRKHFVALFIISIVFICTFCLPLSKVQAKVQNISLTKLVDEQGYKETYFVFVENGKTFHILVTATINIVGSETLIGLTATLVNSHNATIDASARIPDTLNDAPYTGQSVEAFLIHFDDLVVDALKVALPVVIVVALVIQVYMILESIITDVLVAILDIVIFGNFIYASLPWVLLMLLNDENPDGSVDLFIPFSPFGEHFELLMDEHYFIATSLSWWEIEKHYVYTDICLPWWLGGGCYRIVWFSWFSPRWICARAGPPTLKPPQASFLWDPFQPTEGEEVLFASTSFDSDGYITVHHWWLGDGNESIAKNFTHTYDYAGDYNVTLKVTDNDSKTNNITKTVNIQPRPEAKLRVIPTQLTLIVVRGHNVTSKFIVRESLNQTELIGVAFQAADFENPDLDTITSGNVTFDKNGITVPTGSYSNVTMTLNAPMTAPTGWYSGNITVLSENGGNDTIYVELLVSTPLYELAVTSSPVSGITYTINGSERMTPYSQLLPEGFYTLEMPEIHTIGEARYQWNQWSDGSANRIRIIELSSNFTLTAQYTGPYYELTVTSSPINGIPFTINGVPQTTTYNEWLLEDSYLLEMPDTFNGYVWSHWLEDGDTNRIRTITLPGSTYTAVYVSPEVGGHSVSINSELLSTWTTITLLLGFIVLSSNYVKLRIRKRAD